ncbi:hypothetical protein D3C80_1193450 [compost metagenome]
MVINRYGAQGVGVGQLLTFPLATYGEALVYQQVKRDVKATLDDFFFRVGLALAEFVVELVQVSVDTRGTKAPIAVVRDHEAITGQAPGTEALTDRVTPVTEGFLRRPRTLHALDSLEGQLMVVVDLPVKQGIDAVVFGTAGAVVVNEVT